MEHPSSFEYHSDNNYFKPLKWKGTTTELVELLVALDLNELVLNNGGGKLEFTELVRTFETVFNQKLGEPHDLKRKILRRKTKLTVFLDKLKSRF